MTTVHCRRLIIVCIIASLCMSLCGCSNELKYHRIYMAAAAGAAIGAVVGYQSDECEAGAAVGAAVFAVGDLLWQLDEINADKLEDAAEETARGESLFGPRLSARSE